MPSYTWDLRNEQRTLLSEHFPIWIRSDDVPDSFEVDRHLAGEEHGHRASVIILQQKHKIPT